MCLLRLRFLDAHVHHRRMLIGGCLLVILSSVTTLALASRRISAENAAFSVPAAGRCAPSVINRSDILSGTKIAVAPLPDSFDAGPHTQISMLGVPISALSGVTVRGSSSGTHAGHLRAYSQGDGASFVPERPFRTGETVTVTGVDNDGGHRQSFQFHFVIAHTDVLPPYKSTRPKGSYAQMQHFRTRPELLPPSIAVTAQSPTASPGLLFASPYSGPGNTGPMIFDENGSLVWFKPLPLGTQAANLQVQQLNGEPVITWWQGRIPPQGFGEGEEMIYSRHYGQVGRVHAGNGFKADLHDFHLTPQGTALLTVFHPIHCNISYLGGPSGGAVTDAMFQEIDVHTGLVRREWHSIDHIPLSDSYSYAVRTSTSYPFDFFHINSVDQLANGTTLISARNTWALYELNTATGKVLKRMGGKHSSLHLGRGANTAYQHDAEVQPNGTITVFDNGAVPTVHPQSRALILSVDPTAGKLNVVSQYEHHPKALISGSQGNMQTLPNGDYFVGWGAKPYFSEFNAAGQLLFDAHMHGGYQSYRGYRFPWTGEPGSLPSIAAAKSHSHTVVYASWNGDSRTVRWQVLGGSSAKSLAVVASASRRGFETAIPAPALERFVAVQALAADGTVLATSHAIHG